MSEPTVVELVELRELPLGSRGTHSVVVRWSDGTISEAARYYADEWAVTEGDLIGKTRAAIQRLCHARDVAFLQDDDGDSASQPFFL